MISRARGDHHEREAMLSGDACDQRLRAIASGDAQQIGTLGHGLTSYLGDVDGLGPADEKYVRAEVFGLAFQVELLDFPAAGLRIHDQVRVPGRRLRRMLRHPPVRWFPGQRPARGHGGEQPGRGRRDGYPQQVPERVNDDYGNRRKDEDHERQPAPDAAMGKERERGGQAHRRGGQAHGQHRHALQPGENHQDHDRPAREQETQPRQPTLRTRALRARHRRHGSRRRTRRGDLTGCPQRTCPTETCPSPCAGHSGAAFGSSGSNRPAETRVLSIPGSSHAGGSSTSPQPG